MTYKVVHVLQRVATELGATVGVASGGSATSIVDTLGLAEYPDDYFNGGYAIIIRDAGGAGAAPEGEYGRVTNFDKATKTATIETLSAAVAAADRYLLATAAYDMLNVMARLNLVLDTLPIKTVDLTTITTADGQTEYTLPAGLLDDSEVDVWIQGQDVASDNQWKRWHDWYIQGTGTHVQKKLVFVTQPPAPFDLKLEYLIPHPQVYSPFDYIDEQINIDRLTQEVVLSCLYWRLNQSENTDPELARRIATVENRVERARSKHPSTRTDDVKLASMGDTDYVIADTV